MSDKLKTCCGSEPRVITGMSVAGGTFFFIDCQKCARHIGVSGSFQDGAVRLWNGTDDDSRADTERLDWLQNIKFDYGYVMLDPSGNGHRSMFSGDLRKTIDAIIEAAQSEHK